MRGSQKITGILRSTACVSGWDNQIFFGRSCPLSEALRLNSWAGVSKGAEPKTDGFRRIICGVNDNAAIARAVEAYSV
jgi:hypothetical protein